MSPRRIFRSRARWMSAAAVLVVAGVLAGTMLANAAGPPLPKRTPAQLLLAMRNARPPAAFSGVITESANLGFPSLPNIPGLQSSLLSGASLITGTHTVDVWYDGPRHVRIALPVSFGETDLRVDGNQVWLWHSHGQTATHYVLPAHSALPAHPAFPAAPARLRGWSLARPHLVLPRCLVAARTRMRSHPLKSVAARAAILKCLRSMKIGRQVPALIKPLTPRQAVSKFLAAIGPSTKVTVPGSTVVAGRSAYQLVIAPRTNQSLISQIVVAVDAKTHLPLQLQVFARGTSGAAFQIGFTSLTFGKPAASNFTFTPPAGAHVKTENLPAALPGPMGTMSMSGIPAPLPGPLTSQRFLPKSAELPGVPVTFKGRTVKLKMALVLPRQLRVGRKVALPQRLSIHYAPDKYAHWSPQAQVISPVSPFGMAQAAPSGMKVLGSGWLSVAVLPVGSAMPGPGPVRSPAPAKPNSLPVVGQQPIAAPRNQISALLHVLLNSAARVHGTWGSGRLVRTSLASILITSNGRMLIGAVTPAVLYADAAKIK